MKYMSSLNKDKIYQVLSELWPLISVRKMFLGDIFGIHCFIGFIFHTQVYNHKTHFKFD